MPHPIRPLFATFVIACSAPAAPRVSSPAGAQSGPLGLTYLGVAGWQIEGGGKVLLADPYLSRPVDPSAPLVPDVAAIAARTPTRADLVFVGHSHHDHLLDAPSVALRTGAMLLGSASTTRVGRASGLADDHLITVRGGEDFEMDGYSIRAIPSLHSAIGDKHVFGGVIEPDPQLPMPAAGYQEGGTFAYLVRIAGHELLVLDTANFIERELAGLHPDIAIIAPGLREHVHDYTCRLLHAIGDPSIVLATHFDDWTGPAVDAPPSPDLVKFGDEIRRCAPRTRFIVPCHFERIVIGPTQAVRSRLTGAGGASRAAQADAALPRSTSRVGRVGQRP
ncbi:MAG TPA: MBL fold metallo-hydrolase [Kofleriaceae bacterium]|nr:MBL fold metallo-hydrolase [Kofleriaceae bacterium]